MNRFLSKKNRENRGARPIRFLTFATIGATFVVFLLLSPFSAAAPLRGEGSWSDSFSAPNPDVGIEELSGTKVAGGGLKLAETLPSNPDDPGDLGIPVPGESGVYSVLCTDLGASAKNIYSGTGEKGHLVEYDPTQLYQETYHGPTHIGVSNSRGQAVPPDSIYAPSRVTALATDGTLVYGGTCPDGHLFSFEPDDGSGDPVHRAAVDLGAAPGGGSILALAWDGAVLYGGTSNGHLFSYDGTITDLGTTPSGGAVNALTYDGSTLFGGTGNGYLFTYDGSFTELGTPAGGGAINALTNDGIDIYGGTAAGYVFSYDGTFTDLGQPSGSADPVNAVAVTGTTLYSGSENGHVYYGNPGSHQDLGQPEGCEGSPVNALAIDMAGRLYGGTGTDAEGSEGHLFCMGGYEDHITLAPRSISHINFATGKLLFLDDENELYTYIEPGICTDLGSPDETTVTNDMESSDYDVYFGMEDGRLWLYDPSAEIYTDLDYPDYPDSDPITAIMPVDGIPDVETTTVFLCLDGGRLFSGEVNDKTCTYSGLLGETQAGEEILDLAWIGGGSDTLYLAGDAGHLYSYSGVDVDDLGSVPGGSAINGLVVSDGIIYLALESGDMYSFDPETPAFVYLGGSGGSPLDCIEEGDQGIIAGARNGNLYMYDQYAPSGSLWDLGTTPDSTAVLTLCRANGYLWGGNEGGGLFCHDGSYLADRGQQVILQENIWCMEYDPNEQLFYAGTYTSSHFLIIDPVANKVVDRGRPVDGEKELEDIIIASDGMVYGGTYGGTIGVHNPEGGRVFSFDPATGDFVDIGKPPASQEWWVSSLVEGPAPDNLIYGATSWSLGGPTGGVLFSYDPSGGTWDDLGNPMAGTYDQEGTRFLVRADDSYIYGGTWNPADWSQGHIYCYDIGSGTTVVLGATPAGETYARDYVNGLIVLDGKIYGPQDNGNVFRFDADPDPENYVNSLELLGQPVEGAQSVNQPALAADGTLMFGTRGDKSFGPGHVANYDPDSGFRDVGAPLWEYQYRVSALAYSSDLNVTVGGTYGMIDTGGPPEARLFKVDPYIVNEEMSALSTGVFPAVEDLGTPVSGHDEIGALCAAPDDEKTVWGGTANSGTGADDARLFEYDTMTGDLTDMGVAVSGHKKILSLCRSGDGYIYGGTGNESDGLDAHLFRFDPDGGGVEDLGFPLEGAKGIYSLTAGQDGKIYIGMGDKGDPASIEPASLVEYDPEGDTFTNIDEIATSGRGRITALVTGSNGLIYGGTGEYPAIGYNSSTVFFWYDPSTEVLTKRANQTTVYGTEKTTCSIAEVEGKIYCGTGPDGRIYSCSISDNSLHAEVTLPYGGNTPLYAMAGTGDVVYGCAGATGVLFRYEAGSVVDMGHLTYLNEGVKAGTTDNLGKPCFGTSGDVKFVRVDPDIEFDWGTVECTVNLNGQEASIDIMDSTGETLITGLEDVSDGDPLSPAADGETGLHLKGWLRTSDTNVTPEIEEWGLNWQGLPNIDEIEPDKAYRGDEIRIWGSNFGETPDEVDVGGVTISGIPAEDWNDNCIKVEVPGTASNGEVIVRVGADESGPAYFDLYTAPSIDLVNPDQAYIGDAVNITGSCFLDVQDDSYVSFNGTQAVEYNQWTDSLITVEVPPGTSTGGVVVNVRGIDSNSVGFTVLEDPQITGIDPDEACAGEQITVSGLNFLDTQDDSAVMFGEVPAAEYISWSDGSIEVNVPPGAQTGDVTVDVNNGHISNGWEFTVLEDLTVGIESPEDGAVVEGTIDVVANASGGSGISKVELKVDGDIIGSNSSPPYNYSWNTNTVPDGTHTLKVTAFDNSGRSAEDEISVEVDNNETPSASKYWYFAEGCTDYGFETWLLIANPAGREVDTVVEFMDDKGRTELRNYTLLPDSRTTINVADVTGPANVSTKVISENDVVCERTMFWDNRIEGHCSIGTTSLSREWYFAEGCTDYGFETYILLGNPGDGTVNVALDYMLESGQVLTANHQLAAHSRKTVNVVKEIGAGEFSVKATSGEPGIVAERAMYFGGRRCGTGTIGCQAPSTTWYLSEGSTDWGFETWLLLQCPGEDQANITVTYQKSTGEREKKDYTVPARSRFTADLSEEVGVADVSTMVESDQPVVCERAMYWDGRSAGHCTIGSPETGTSWYLAEGCSDYGFETWVLLNNPNDEPVDAILNFLKDDGTVVPAEVRVPSYSRVSVNAADFVPGSSFSTKVEASLPLMVERAMYWNGRQGGTGSIGAK